MRGRKSGRARPLSAPPLSPLGLSPGLTATNRSFRKEFWPSRAPVDAPPSPPEAAVEKPGAGGGCFESRSVSPWATTGWSWRP